MEWFIFQNREPRILLHHRNSTALYVQELATLCSDLCLLGEVSRNGLLGSIFLSKLANVSEKFSDFSKLKF